MPKEASEIGKELIAAALPYMYIFDIDPILYFEGCSFKNHMPNVLNNGISWKAFTHVDSILANSITINAKTQSKSSVVSSHLKLLRRHM